MANHLPRLQQIYLKPTREKSALLFRLTFQPSQRQTSHVVFELHAGDAMHLLSALQGVQRRTGWRVPQFFSRDGKPNLRVVRDE
jgi:hypothetical protein